MTPDKNSRDKLNGHLREGAFLGVIWRNTEYINGTDEGIFKCATIKDRPEESAYNPKCLDYITVPYDQYVLDGASSQGARLRFAESSSPVDNATPMPRSGVEWAKHLL